MMRIPARKGRWHNKKRLVKFAKQISSMRQKPYRKNDFEFSHFTKVFFKTMWVDYSLVFHPLKCVFGEENEE